MSDPRLPSLAGLRGPVPRIDTESNLAPIQRLPDDALEMIRKNILDGDDTDDVCKNFARYCATSTITCKEEAWKQACEVLGVFDNLKVKGPHRVGDVFTDARAGVRDERNVVFPGMSYKNIFLTLCDELTAQRVVAVENGRTISGPRFDNDWSELYLISVKKGGGFTSYIQFPGKRMHSTTLIRDTVEGSYLQRLFHAWGFTGTKDSDWEGLDRILINAFTRPYSSLIMNVVASVVEEGADVDFVSQSGYTPLHVAATELNHRGVNFLLGYGANPNSQTNFGDTPLMIAMLRDGTAADRLLVVQALIENGADVNLENNKNWTALDMAFIRDRSACALSIIKSKNFDANRLNNHNATPIFGAIRWGDVDAIDALLPLINNENINRESAFRNTPFMAAVQSGDINVVRAVLSDPRRRIDINHRNAATPPSTALGYARAHLASGDQRFEAIVNLLLARSAVE